MTTEEPYALSDEELANLAAGAMVVTATRDAKRFEHKSGSFSYSNPKNELHIPVEKLEKFKQDHKSNLPEWKFSAPWDKK